MFGEPRGRPCAMSSSPRLWADNIGMKMMNVINKLLPTRMLRVGTSMYAT